MKTIGFRYRVIIGCILTLLVACNIWVVIQPSVALADDASDNSVISDLERDPSFNASDYPTSNNGRDLFLITIAESTDRSLILYVYQPYVGVPYYAKSVRMSTLLREDTFVNTMDYTVSCIGHEGVFYKYVVNNYEVSNDTVRHYNIVQLMRKYMSGIDSASSYDDSINAVAFKVARQYVFSTDNGVVTNTEKGIDVVTITDKFVGFVRIESDITSGQIFKRLYDDSHFIAFNCDRAMDNLIEAKVSYYRQRVWKVWSETSFRYGAAGREIKLLRANETVSIDNTSNGLDAMLNRLLTPDFYHYEWNEIQSVSEFLTSTNREIIYQGLVLDTCRYNRIVDDAAIANKTWVLNYAQTQTEFEPAFYDFEFDDYTAALAKLVGELISRATILELMFEHEGKTYQLGVVDGESTPSDHPINEQGTSVSPGTLVPSVLASLPDFGKILSMILGGILGVLIVLLIARAVFLHKEHAHEDPDDSNRG